MTERTHRQHARARVRQGLAAAAILGAVLAAGCATVDAPGSGEGDPILIAEQGSFAVGGTMVSGEAGSQSCDHGYAEYQIPPNPRAVNLLMWHSAAAHAWQNRWDGGEGFQSIFVRRGFPVYIWDGPRVGRANWGCEQTTYAPEIGRDQNNFGAWRFGEEYPNWFDGVQFPKDDPEAWNQAMRARYQEFDTMENAALQATAAAALTDHIGPTVALTNSAGGLRALLAAIESEKLVGIVMYENVGYLFPPGEVPDIAPDIFGPTEIPLEEFEKLTRIPIQVVWGDNVVGSSRYDARHRQSQAFVEAINRHGGQAEILMLNEDAGLVGNTHIPFADLNNVAVADLLSEYLERNGLDGR